ncbi:MAG: hypothetical protein ARM1_0250 [Candidatus Micrarchaeota archaeon]|nr:MAG: hypothetical protein ARM1_0250 [Candidatus Micrarchaeota archaeon]
MEIFVEKDRITTKTEHGIAEVDYNMLDSNTISFYRVYVPVEDRSKGIAEELCIEAFKYAIEKGLKIVPDCPYIRYTFLKKHPEYMQFVIENYGEDKQ